MLARAEGAVANSLAQMVRATEHGSLGELRPARSVGASGERGGQRVVQTHHERDEKKGRRECHQRPKKAQGYAAAVGIVRDEDKGRCERREAERPPKLGTLERAALTSRALMASFPPLILILDS
jgi:hypothetical protein